MLTTVLDVYLAELPHERVFDGPFLALLPQLGFFDIHYTHGSGEFGKDFIAKKREGRRIIQYSFQLKRDVSQSEWRNIQHQLLEAVITPLTHPHFSNRVPHQPVLVSTGRLANNAAVGAANLNIQLERLNALPLEVWERPQLVRDLSTHGLSDTYHFTVQSISSYGRFYTLYGEALEGRLSPRDLEAHSRTWLHIPKSDVWPPTPQSLAAATPPTSQEVTGRLLTATLEASLLAGRCRAANLRYEALVCYLAAWRAVLHAWHGAKTRGDSELANYCRELQEQARIRTHEAAKDFTLWVEKGWRAAPGKLALRVAGLADLPSQVMSYPVHCARIVEALALRYLLADDLRIQDDDCASIASFLKDFVAQEPGCSRPVSDYYAVSYMWPLLVLGLSGYRDSALAWWRRLAVWLGDRYQHGAGLAHLEATPDQEAAVLLGYAFDFIPGASTSCSLLTTVLADVIAWFGEARLYEAFVSDLEPLKVHPTYFQPSDSEGLYRFEAPDVVHHPAVTYRSNLSPFAERDFASHIRREPTHYTLSNDLHLDAFAALSLLLRDRTFPGQWPLASSC